MGLHAWVSEPGTCIVQCVMVIEWLLLLLPSVVYKMLSASLNSTQPRFAACFAHS